MTPRRRHLAPSSALPLAALLSACTGPPQGPPLDATVADLPPPAPDGATARDAPDDRSHDAAPATPRDASTAWDAGAAPCEEVDRFVPVFAAPIARWVAQDDRAPWGPDAVVFVGSSSIRRWESLARSYTDYAPIQRGVGGAQLGEVARAVDDLVLRHRPRAVVVYAGTNDLAAGVSPAVVLDRFRCLRHRVGARLGWQTPVLFVSVVPAPSRWDNWPAARALNAAVEALAADDPGLAYVDVATPFLATGAPPDAALFVDDRLHLTARGYEVFHRPIRAALEAAVGPRPATSAPSLFPPGARILVDLGPSNPEDGEVTPSPDAMGQHWNNWHPLQAPGEVLPGERLAGLVTTTGAPTAVALVVAGGFLANGRRNGGLRWPDARHLGSLAMGSATGDFFFTQDADAPGALALRGLDPGRAYTLRLFGARDATEVRVTRYTVWGATSDSASLQTSGPGAGRDATHTNDDDVAVLRGLRPDAWGQLFVDVAIERGAFAYLSAFELLAE